MAAKNDDDKKEVLVTHGEMKDLVGSIVGETLAKVLPPLLGALKAPEAETAETPEESRKKLIAELKGLNRPLPPCRRERRRSLETKATFIALIVPNSFFPNGRVEKLEEYTHPEGSDVHESDGGLVPDGMSIKHPNTGVLQPKFKQWRYERYMLEDSRRFVRDDRSPHGKGVENLERYSELIESLGELPARMPDPSLADDE